MSSNSALKLELLDYVAVEEQMESSSFDRWPKGVEVQDQKLTCSGWSHTFEGKPRRVYLTGDRILVCTQTLHYHAWGHLGPAFLMDKTDGRVVAELRGERGLALANGDFLLGLEGYDDFDTWRYSPDGELVDSWRSYGHYIEDDSGIRVVERDRQLPTRSHVVRLEKSGEVLKGQKLEDCLASEPVVLPNGTLLILDGHRILAVGRELSGSVLANLQPEVPDVSSGSLRLEGQVLIAHRQTFHPELVSHIWRFALRES